MATTPEPEMIREAVALACRAPSVHNSQPWRWLADGERLHLSVEHEPLTPATDRSGRDALLGCGAALDHLQVAMAAHGWEATAALLPDRDRPDLLATLHFMALPEVTGAHRQRAEAIRRRHTDRLPFAAPTGWGRLEAQLRSRADPECFDTVDDDAREQLAEVSRLTVAIRRGDPLYQSELRWWTTPLEPDQGVPASARISADEAARLDVARGFPTTGYGHRRAAVDVDHAKIVVLSTPDDTRLQVLRCGQVLSAVLLDCTQAGMATCILTHLIEVAPARQLVRRLVAQSGQPQLLIRVGRTPAAERSAPATPRHPVDEVLQFR